MTPQRWKKRATRSRRTIPSSSTFDEPKTIMTSELPKISVAETLAEKIGGLQAGGLPAATTRKCEDLLIDVVGLCVTARNQDYVESALAGWDDDGPCTVIGHSRTLNASGAAFVNGTAAHGEDFDDTFEGGPVHAGAVIVPAVLAACERHNPDGRTALIGIAVGTEVLCRLSLVVRKAVPRPQCQADRGRTRNRRQHGGRHHRISRRRRMDQAAACGLGGSIRHSGGIAGAAGICRSAHGVRGRAWAVPRLCAHHERRLRGADRRFRHALGDGYAGIQALSVRDD